MTNLTELPLIRFLPGAVAAGLLLLWLRRRSGTAPERRNRALTTLCTVCGAAALAVYAAVAVVSLRSFMLDLDEANILSVSAASLHGQPVYHDIHSPDLSYSLMYGPVTFLIYRALLLLGDGAMPVIRLAVVLANAGLLAILYRIARRFLPSAQALALLAYPVCLLLQQPRIALGARPDVWLLLFLALAVWVVLQGRGAAAVATAGALLALALDLKLTAGPAVLVVLWMLFRRFGLRYTAAATALLAGVLLAPFALPNVSLRNYIAWLRLTGTEGMAVAAFWSDLLYACLLCLPLLLLLARRGDRRKGMWPGAVLLSLAIVAAVVAGAKPGAGPWYFFPVLPVLLGFLAFESAPGTAGEESPAGRNEPWQFSYLAWLSAAFLVLQLSYLQRTWINLRLPSAGEASLLRAARKELASDRQTYAGHPIQMAYGPQPNGPAELMRYLLVLHGEPYTLDGSVRLETYLVPFPDGIAAHMASCRDDLWLLPRGDEPFPTTTFRAALHDVFLAHYRPIASDTVYDVWQCKPAPLPRQQ